MGSLIYVHHRGQFLNLDTTSKIQTELGQVMFTEVLYDMTYSLPKILNEENGTTCSDEYNDNLDTCIVDVHKLVLIILNFFN